MEIWQQDLVKLLLAVAVGGVIGLEREVRDKPAGFRTMILIAVGSTLFTIFSIRIAGDLRDPGRIAAQIVTGVGFLGAGAILRDRRQVIGLTTAAAIWLVASLGIGVGMGEFRTTLAASGLVMVVLLGFAHLERWLDQKRDDHTYQVAIRPPTHNPAIDEIARIRGIAEGCGLRLVQVRVGKGDGFVKMWFRAIGTALAHRQLTDQLLTDAGVTDLTRES